MRLSSILIVTLVASAFFSGCRSQRSSDAQLSAHILPNPPRVGPVVVRIRLTDSQRTPIRAAQVSVEADMSHPGMKPLFQKASAAGNGEYECKLNFDMPGDWILSLHAKLADGRTADNQVSLTVLEK